MRKKKYNDVQIVKVLKEGESDAMKSSDIQKMKALEEENRKLKEMYANLSLENNALNGIIEKNF